MTVVEAVPTGGAAWPALGTTAVLRMARPEALAAARRRLEDELAAIDLACSRFRPDAELVAVNAQPGRWLDISPLLADAVAVALRAARQTGGTVDPTVGKALRRLGYDRDFALIDPYGPIQFEAVPGWQQVELDHRHRRLRLPPGVELDLGATAKALAADRAAERILADTGVGVLVCLGGDLAISGPPPTGGWPVLVTDDHRAPADADGQQVSLVSGGLATSSVTTRSWSRQGTPVHHIVDPATGRPAEGPWRTVSVAAATCVDANTAATAAVVFGATAADWLESAGLPARLVAHDGQVRLVGGWPEAE